MSHHLHHPDVHHTHSEWSEAETLHVAVAYSNPCRWSTRRKLLNDFRRHMSGFANVRLYVGELAYGDRPFEVTGESDSFHHENDIQFRTKDVLWHKENLINAIVSRWPSGWKYGAYIDGDMTFTRRNWAIEAIHQLQRHPFVQLFSSYADLDSHQMPYRFTKSFARSYLDGEHGRAEYDRRGRMGKAVATGGAWAFTREAFDQVGGLLDCSVLGSCDWHMAVALVDGNDLEINALKYGCGLAEAIHVWQNRAAAFHCNIGCLDQHIIHHFHGSKRNRGYGVRDDIMRRHDFEPTKDICRDWQGIYRWAGNKPNLENDVWKYFQSRNEDSTELTDGRTVKWH